MIVYGKQVFFYILARHKGLVKGIYLAKECAKAEFNTILKAKIPIKRLDAKKAQALAKNGNHQGFLLDIEEPILPSFESVKSEDFVVVLNGISDVGNIGAIARTAYALGVNALVVVAKSLAMQGVIRASSGAALDLKIALNADINAVLNELKQQKFTLFAAVKGGARAKKVGGKKCLVLGAEGFGLSAKVIAKCDESVGVAMKNDFDSLNVGAAFAIICDRMVNE